MTSAGGLLPVADAAELPAALLLSGPAGGVRAGAAAATVNGFPDAVTFDMGGTTTDVCLCSTAPRPPRRRGTSAASRSGCPRSTCTPSAPAAGRSLASTPGGALVVGPQSAGADPGPACYGRGGSEPTVTDADLVAGRIPPEATFPGLGRSTAPRPAGALDGRRRDRRRRARGRRRHHGAGAARRLGGAGRRPAGTGARRVRRGGTAARVRAGRGAGHAGGRRAAPRRRAVGRRPADRSPKRDLVRSWPTPQDHSGLDAARSRLARTPGPSSAGDDDEVAVTTALDCRYAGQSHELTVGDVAAFHEEHRRRNGYARPDAPGRGGGPARHGDPATRGRARGAAPARTPRRSPGARSRWHAGTDRGDGPGGDRRARLHGVGARRLAGATVARRAGGRVDAATPLAGADLAADRRRRGDGRGAAPRRVQPQHQGAGRLLGRAVHGRRRAARAGRAHPGAPRVDAGVGARRHRRLRRRHPARRPGDAERPVRGRNPPQRRHARRPVPRRRAPRRLGRQPRPPRRRRRDRARLDPGRRHRDPAGGPAPPARAARRRAAPPSSSPTRARPTSARRPRRAGGRQRGRRRAARRPRRTRPLAEVVDYGERRMRAALADLPDGTWRFDRRPRLDRGRARPATPGPDRASASRSTATRSRSTSPAPTRSARAT